jgi:hypothetical protein
MLTRVCYIACMNVARRSFIGSIEFFEQVVFYIINMFLNILFYILKNTKIYIKLLYFDLIAIFFCTTSLKVARN